MTRFVVDRAQVTSKILGLINPDYSSSDLQNALLSWWMNLRTGGGLRLTPVGFTALNAAGIQGWDLECSQSYLLRADTQIKLDHYLHCPYYLFLNRSSVRIYDGRIVTLAGLMGSLQDYLEKLAIKRPKN